MRKKLILMTIALACATAQGAWAQQDGSPLRPVSAADVKVTAINDAYFTDEGIVVVSPDEDPEPALARRRVSGMTDEGGASLTGAKLYSYTYPSVDADGNTVTLSSLMAVPTKMLIDNVMAKPNNLIIGCHVTITSNYECPTEYNKSGGTFSWMTDVGMLIDYTRYDAIRNPCCLVIMPDYEGYGVTKNRAHPYLYQELTARQVVDAVRSGLALYEQNIGFFSFSHFEDGWKSVCIGYSQGGSVALATHRFIEENGLAEELHFAGSVCGDGPYDPVAHLGYYMNDDGETYDGTNRTKHKKGNVSMPIVMPLILKGMCDRNPFMRQHQLSDYLSEKFLRTGVIDFINAKSNENKDRQYSTDKINKAFRNMRANGQKYTVTDEQGAQTEHSYSAEEMRQMLCDDDGDNVYGKLSEMMTESAFGYFNSLSQGSSVPSDRGVMKDLHRALASNARVSGWTPSHRIAFYHSTYDTVVPYENLLSFIRHQGGLNYYFNSRQRSENANVTPTHMVDKEENADVFIYDDDSKKDHVGAGKDFYFMDSPSPDYKLMKWVVEGKKDGAPSAASSDDDLITITLHNGSKNITAEAYRRGSSIIVGNGQNACISQYTEGPINIPGTVEIGGQNYNVEVNQLAFRLCNKITEVTIGEGATWIGDFAFVGCSSLQKVTLPSTLNRIGGGAFVNLPNLTEVKCNAADAPAWLYNDLFAYEGTASATAKLATQRTLYVPRASARKYRNSKYNGEVGWGDAFALISEATAPTKTMTISSFSDLNNLADAVNNGSNDYADYTIRLTADLILNGDKRENWYALIPIGTAAHPFRGVFDGQGHTIKNVQTYRDNGTNVGLFGYTDGAVISNLILQNISLKGESNVGVVVGNANYSMIHDVLVYDAKATNGTQYYCAEATDGNAGGLVGKADNSTIIDSYFYGKVKGIAAAGGIVGESAATDVSDCAAGNSIEATTIAGGIVGKAGTATKVARCYSRSTLSATTVAGIIGQHQGDSESSVSNCAYLSANESLLVAVAAGEASEFTATGNRRCATVSEMEGLKLQDLLGDDKWYYFHKDISDCPVPASLADAYLAWAGMKDANGYIYTLNEGGTSYSIIGYEGSETELVLPTEYKNKPVTKVGDRAFKGSAITYMTIPDCYASIGTEAFADCPDLVYLFMGDGVTSAYNGWLEGCPNITSLWVEPDNPAYSYTNETLYDKSMTRLIRCEKGIEGTLTLPATVTKIEPGAFVNCDNLNIVDMRETTTNWKELDRNLSTNPIYGASIYTLFLLNEASYYYNYLNGEPNVVTYDGEKYHCLVLNIDDSRGFQCPVKFDATKVNYNRQFTAALSYDVEDVENRTSDFVYKPKAYTLALPFYPVIPVDKGLKIYDYIGVTTEDGVTTVSFQEVVSGKKHAGKPYCLVMEGEDPVNIYGSEANINAQSPSSGSVLWGDYSFHGTYVKIPNETLYNASQPAYILQSDGNWHKVPENQPKAYVGPFRAYFRAVTPSAGARALVTSFGDGDETGIHQTVMRTIDHDGTEHYYDLNGHRLSGKPQQGIYIHQGKKYVAK
jgi:hypothetical protein